MTSSRTTEVTATVNSESSPALPSHQQTPTHLRADQAPSTIHGLYLHVPFCFHKCHYCDFYSLVDGPGRDRQGAFVDAMILELDRVTETYRPRPETLFVGGGTPTLLRPDLWRRLLHRLSELGLLHEVVEFTVEANPETVTDELAAALAAGGVNRVSIGAQSFDRDLLQRLERWHEPENVGRAVDRFRTAGIDNINLDLIFAIPGQTLEQLDADLDAALALEPTHLSCYSLIFEPNTPLTRKLQLGRVRQAGEDLERALYERVIERLADAGYEHYEVSNWCRPGRPCRHNLMYWRNENWLGIGPSAASHVAGWRWKNEPHLGRYLSGAPTTPVTDLEHLPRAARVGEALMLGLRLRQGVDLAWLDSQLEPEDERRRTIDELIDAGLLEKSDARLRLTDTGLFVADGVLAGLL